MMFLNMNMSADNFDPFVYMVVTAIHEGLKLGTMTESGLWLTPSEYKEAQEGMALDLDEFIPIELCPDELMDEWLEYCESMEEEAM